MIARWLARRRWQRAVREADAYRGLRLPLWQVRVQIAFDQRAQRLGMVYVLTL